MELLALTQRVLEIFECDLDGLGARLMESLEDESKLDAVAALPIDSLQKVYQYYLADRKGMKQDFTPRSLAELADLLAGDCEVFVDLCAGTGALTLSRWSRNPEQKFELYEIDENVVPFLIFNLVVRNIDAVVYVGDEFAAGGQVVKKAKFFTTTKSDGIVIRCSTKDGVPLLIQDFLTRYGQRVRFLNEEENRLLAEYRDALLPKLMSGEIDYEKNA